MDEEEVTAIMFGNVLTIECPCLTDKDEMQKMFLRLNFSQMVAQKLM